MHASDDEPQGRSSFPMSPQRQAEVADDETLAGIAFGLPGCPHLVLRPDVSTGPVAPPIGHGVTHGREPRNHMYQLDEELRPAPGDLEWASRRLAAEAGARKEAGTWNMKDRMRLTRTGGAWTVGASAPHGADYGVSTLRSDPSTSSAAGWLPDRATARS